MKTKEKQSAVSKSQDVVIEGVDESEEAQTRQEVINIAKQHLDNGNAYKAAYYALCAHSDIFDNENFMKDNDVSTHALETFDRDKFYETFLQLDELMVEIGRHLQKMVATAKKNKTFMLHVNLKRDPVDVVNGVMNAIETGVTNYLYDTVRVLEPNSSRTALIPVQPSQRAEFGPVLKEARFYSEEPNLPLSVSMGKAWKAKPVEEKKAPAKKGTKKPRLKSATDVATLTF